jgi:diaminopimelate decarboxylase
MRMGGGPQQFGIDAEEIPSLLRSLAVADLDLLGFHVFAGSQNLHADILCEALSRNVELLLKLASQSPWPVRYLNLGGGFGIPYSDKDQPLDLMPVGTRLKELMESEIRPSLPDARVVIELGRYIVGESGVYVTRVVDRKVSRGRVYLVVDGGLPSPVGGVRQPGTSHSAQLSDCRWQPNAKRRARDRVDRGLPVYAVGLVG